jgi:antitoxin component YwqK of YwqJK toxin-antitoxin module
MRKYWFYLSVLLSVFSTFDVQAKASDEVEDYECSEKEDKRIYCVYKNTFKPVTGKIKKRNGDNYVSIENFSKGYLDGLCSYFNSDGRIKERTYYKQGIKNGTSKIYYPNRSYKSVINYKDGDIDGMVDIYAEDSKLLGRMKYKKGKLVRGYCVNSKGKKEDLSHELIKNHGENALVTCGG